MYLYSEANSIFLILGFCDALAFGVLNFSTFINYVEAPCHGDLENSCINYSLFFFLSTCSSF